MNKAKIVTLGAGMASYGASYRLKDEKIQNLVYEKESIFGGHTASYSHQDKYVFDDGPHVSFTQDKRIQDIFADCIDGKYQVVKAGANNYWNGHWFKHPVQCNLHGLPDDLVVKCLTDFVKAQYQPEPEVHNYHDWLLASYGETLATTFPVQYTQKYHTTSADNMSTVWLGPRLYRPELEEIFRGAITFDTPDVHYVDHFRYPTDGGFASYLQKFPEWADLRLDHQVVTIDPTTKQVHFQNGEVCEYEQLISSIPLPALIPLISGAPARVKAAASKLAATSAVMVNVAIDRVDFSDYTWTYFYDDDIFFTRLSYPHMLSPNTVPPGVGAIQAEVYYSDKYRPLDRSIDECIEPVIASLRKCGLIKDTDEVLFSNASFCKYANVIFDLDREEALPIVHRYLDEIGIHYCGRYGEWGYQWTDEAFKSGESAAAAALAKL